MRPHIPLLFLLLPVASHVFAAEPNSIDLSAIDTSCKPCDDFYQFAVGAWHARNPIPANNSRWGKRWASADTNLEVLHGIAQSAMERQAPTGDDKVIGDFYAACMDTTTIDRAGIQPIESLLARIRAVSTMAQLQAEMAALAREGIQVPLAISPRQHPDEPSQVVSAISPAGWSLPDRDYFLKDDPRSKTTRERFSTYAAGLLALAGWTTQEAHAAVNTILAIETAYARAQMTRVEYRDPYKVNNLRTVAELQRMTPSFDWARYLQSIGVDPQVTTVVRDPQVVAEMERQLQHTPLADWKIWLQWRLLRNASPHLSKPYRDAHFAFETAFLTGHKEQSPRWKTCVSAADSLLGDTMGRAYAAKVFPPAAKAKMQEMIANLRAALAESIQGLEWMTAETKQRALAKLDTFDPKVGYPDPWRSYKGSPIRRDNYLANVRAAAQASVADGWAQIGKPVDRTRWGMTVPTSNAYYNPARNEIVFPAGILTPPMFDPNAEDAVNYGSIGVVIGHEISHGYDDQGSQFDAAGRLKNWWTPTDRKQFLDRAQCVVEQFNGYEIEPGVAHNGKLVLGESIGDLAGARIAYAAYLRSLKGKPRPPVLNGYTPEQRFFIAWGQSRGDSTRIETQRQMVLTDPHPVAKFRVIGPLANMPEFHAAFACKRGDAMVRPAGKQCKIW